MCCLAPFVAMAGPPAIVGKPLDASQVRGWLMRIHEAANTRNFQGTFIVSSGNVVSSARIAHYADGPNQYERIESMDGQSRIAFRVNDLVHTVWPGNRVVLVEQRNLVTSFPAVLQGVDDRIAEFYEGRDMGLDRVTGLEANVLFLRPRDGQRFGYRLWADRDTGLLLKADVVNKRNEVLETSAFSDVSINVKSQPETVSAPMKIANGYRVVRLALTPARLESEGWEMQSVVPGFRQVNCVKRPLEGPARPDGGEPAQLLQVIYADGLTYVSIFIEHYDPARHKLALSTMVGATQTVMRQMGDYWITLVGDVPPETLQAFADGLQRKK